MKNSPWVCVEHRYVARCETYIDPPLCPKGCVTINFGYKWRAPKKTNDRAWKTIEAGTVLWEDNTADGWYDPFTKKWVYRKTERFINRNQRHLNKGLI